MTTTKKTKQKVATEFENRLCVFLDFLGFRDHLNRADADPSHVKRISEAFACFNENLKQGNGILDSRQYSQYSDCVTLSCRVDEPSSVYYLLSELLEIQIALAGRGFLMRGGVTVGQLVHDEEQLFGPAQVRAFELESREAIYPRILVDEQVIEIGRSCPAPHHDPDDEEGYLRSIVSQDFDGRLFIGYTTYRSIVEVVGVEADEYAPYMAQVIKIVEQGLQSKDAPTLAKNLWLYGKYLEAREDIKPEFHDTHFPNTLLPIAQKAYQAVLAHVEKTPKDGAKCALPPALVHLFESSKTNRTDKATGAHNR
ncbi:hypothetical protein [Stenotrophomonas maltophilia]|uniref:hypothetical protein n=1 Tax=Stenotrophomonas maltophilia TaxID=40324 RepID=UPI0021C66A49|nr:hypothetical protein [Stenotrophomonas maltophilia]MCU1137040.1 hypothetical protein [Stenotrophomonas maltophilia]